MPSSPPPPELYTLSLHDALPISRPRSPTSSISNVLKGMEGVDAEGFVPTAPPLDPLAPAEALPWAQDFATVGHLYRGIANGLSHLDRKSTRLNSSHLGLSYAVFSAPTRALHSFPTRRSSDLEAALTHFLYLERPEGDGRGGRRRLRSDGSPS